MVANDPRSELLLAAQKAQAERSLYRFAVQAWPIVEPHPYLDSWHVKAICDHLQAVSEGKIRKLLINIPPRCSKSLLVSVFWPAWSLARMPWSRWLFSSYSQDLSKRDSLKCRTLLESPWFRQRWGSRAKIRSDQNEKTRFDLVGHGFRLATSVGGMATGEGGDFIVADDPHNIVEARSKPARQQVIDWWSQSMSTRGNNPDTVARVIVMQRVHEEDLAGYVLANEAGWEHLCLPMRFDPERACQTSIGWQDPRSEAGELLCPVRFDEQAVGDLERSLGPAGTAGQLQQRPTADGGNMFDRSKITIVGTFPRRVIGAVRYWDKAGTQNNGDYSAGVLIAEAKDEAGLSDFFVVDVVRGRWSYLEREKIIKQTAKLDAERFGGVVRIGVEQEPASGGKESAERTVRMLAGYNVFRKTATGDKEVRAAPFSAQWEAGNVKLVVGGWNREYLEELSMFPNGKHDDQVDASSGAFNELTLNKKQSIWVA